MPTQRPKTRQKQPAPAARSRTPRLRFRISISLDGFVAGPNQSVADPLGVGGERLHEWIFPLKFWYEMAGKKGGRSNASDRVIREEFANIGATIMGRNMFGGHPGKWDADKPWRGWWGENPPYHHPVFVITHHAREPLVMKGGTTFNFVTDGIESGLAQARRAAGTKDITLGGGASIAQQYLRAGLVDEMDLAMVPILLGSGERLFEGVTDVGGLELVRTVATSDVVHLKFAKP
jgi:dihydrofolate reductase